MRPLVLAFAAGAGVHLLQTRRPEVARHRLELRGAIRRWMAQAGLGDVPTVEFAAVIAVLGSAGAGLAWLLFGGPSATLLSGALCAAAPVAGYRRRRRRTLLAAQEAWPRLIEEIRVLTGSAGRPIPQALFDAARQAPPPMQPAFAAARREWSLTTDFERTLGVLVHRLADPGADVTCETLLVAHQVGGTDLDRRLAALAEDRRTDGRHRREARAGQAGARFARRFVLLVPLGMALAGASVGDGRAAYRTTFGQVAVLVGVATMAACWAWAGRIMRLPDERRVADR